MIILKLKENKEGLEKFNQVRKQLDTKVDDLSIDELFVPYEWAIDNNVYKEWNMVPDTFEIKDMGIYIANPEYVMNILDTLTNLNIKSKAFFIYGLCDNASQVLTEYENLVNDPDKIYLITLFPFFKKDEKGFKFSKHGKYIGKKELKGDLLIEQEDIEIIFQYLILEIKK